MLPFTIKRCSMSKVVIVGAGQAGSEAATHLRGQGFDGEITLIGAENVLPYQRPPLSKKYVAGDIGKERLYLKPESFYHENKIKLRLGLTVKKINRIKKLIETDSVTYEYDQLILTTGSSPNQFPGNFGKNLSGIYYIRNLDDADKLKEIFEPGKTALILGGGYIGLEGAAVARLKDLNVIVVEKSKRILNRVACEQTSNYFRKLHQDNNVKIVEGYGVDRFTHQNGKINGVFIEDGSYYAVDIVIAGIGISPCTKLAEDAGLEIANGIKTNKKGQTSDPCIWAAGDCSAFPFGDKYIRLESVQNAIDQSQLIAKNILGANLEYKPIPWFWSDQYDVKLQIAGLNNGYNQIVSRINKEAVSVSNWYYKDDTFLAVDAINDSRAYMVGKRFLEAGISPNKLKLPNPEIDLKDLLTQ